jgi:hypothetical protein
VDNLTEILHEHVLQKFTESMFELRGSGVRNLFTKVWSNYCVLFGQVIYGQMIISVK